MQFFTLICCCPFLPTEHCGLLQRSCHCILWRNNFHAHRHLLFKQKSMPLVNEVSRMTSFKSSRLFPCPHLKDLTCPPQLFSCLLLLHSSERRHSFWQPLRSCPRVIPEVSTHIAKSAPYFWCSSETHLPNRCMMPSPCMVFLWCTCTGE